jgi:Ca2+-binding EF-hand superfamily protein
MRFACAIGLGLAFLFAGEMARAQQTQSPAKPIPTTLAVNKTTCEKSVAKVGTSAPSVRATDLFAAMDVNKDGKIVASEFKGPKKGFAWVDTDHDGAITRPEATRAYLAIVGGMTIEQRIKAFKDMDTNKDGKVSQAEYKGPARRFARIDVNHDGVITPQESRNAFRHSVGRYVIALRFRNLDTNHDGVISATEFKGPQVLFARFDQDKNGTIGRAEYAKLIRERVAARLQFATAKPATTPTKPVAVVKKTDVAKPVKTVSAPKPVTAPAACAKTKTVSAPKAVTPAVAPIKTVSAPKPVAPAAPVNFLNRILAMDANKDGKVGMGEYFKAVEARFVFLDQDKDGYITACDLAKVAELRKARSTGAPVVGTPANPPVKPATLKKG